MPVPVPWDLVAGAVFTAAVALFFYFVVVRSGR